MPLYTVSEAITPTIITTSNTNTALTSASNSNTLFIGTTNGQRITLPDATTLAVGAEYEFTNDTPTMIPVFLNGGALLGIVFPSQKLDAILNDNSTAAGSWNPHIEAPGQQNQPALIDDFVSASTTTGTVGALGWAITSTNGAGALAYQSATANRYGVLRISTANTNNGAISLNLGTTLPILLGSGIVSLEAYVSIPTLGGALTAAFTTQVGLMDTSNAADAANGVYFEYAGTAAGTINWSCKTASASTRTTTGSGVAVSAGTWYKLGIVVNTDASSIAFYINNNFITATTTNIPTTGIAPSFRIFAGSTNAAAKSSDIDYFNTYKDFNTVR